MSSQLPLPELIYESLCEFAKEDLNGFLGLITACRTKDAKVSFSARPYSQRVNGFIDVNAHPLPIVKKYVKQFVSGEGLEITLKAPH